MADGCTHLPDDVCMMLSLAPLGNQEELKSGARTKLWLILVVVEELVELHSLLVVVALVYQFAVAVDVYVEVLVELEHVLEMLLHLRGNIGSNAKVVFKCNLV